MTRWMVGVGTVALAVAAFAGPAAAKTADPCKLLKGSEIQEQFGAEVSVPDRGLKTATTVECTWDVAASPTRPAGSVTARIMFVGGKAAYTGLKTSPAFVPVAGLKSSLYQASSGALGVLAGKNLVTVQGVFLTPPPVSVVDVQAQLVPLAKLASKRA
ncbi:MAG: hypothetical protein WDA60_18905 [Acidimicrobiia bacterium]|jgi:hypothetical protein